MYVTQDRKHLVVPWIDEIGALMPHAKRLAHNGADYAVVPNLHTETKLLRNMGIDAPSPIFTKYDWNGTTPWEVQKVTAGALVENKQAYVLSGIGTGKTFACLLAADYLIETGQAKRVLVDAPLSVLELVWAKEIFLRTPHRACAIAHGSAKTRAAAIAKDVPYTIINHHGVAVCQGALMKAQFDIVIIDELAVFRNKRTELWKSLASIVAGVVARQGWVWGLTGAPTPRSPTDIYGQGKLITPQTMPVSFRSLEDQLMAPAPSGKLVPRRDANEIIATLLKPAVRFALDDVMELPETVHVRRKVTMERPTEAVYRRMQSACEVDFAAGRITAVNAAVMRNKLLQIGGGWAYADETNVGAQPPTGITMGSHDGRAVACLPVGPRLEATLEECDNTAGKALVFVPYLHTLAGVASYLANNGRRVEVVHGGTSVKERTRIFNEFQNNTWGINTLVAHPKCMAHGLTLTAADLIVWYVPMDDFEIVEQANGRVRRPGQFRRTRIVYLVGSPADQSVVNSNRQRDAYQSQLLALLAGQTIEEFA